MAVSDTFHSTNLFHFLSLRATTLEYSEAQVC